MLQIFINAPLWVWPLFVLLLMVGVRAQKDRRAPVVLIYCLPLLGILAFRTVWSLSAPGWIMAVFGAAYVLGLAVGYVVQRRWIIDGEGWHVDLRGESWTLLAMMLTFWANFAAGFLQAVAPAVHNGAPFQIGLAVVIGLCGGSFAGRALRVWRAMRGSVYIGTP